MYPLLEPLPGVAPAEKGSIRTNKRGLFEAFDLQDCFLLALGSGKHRSEIHAWQNKNIRHQLGVFVPSIQLSFQEPVGQGGSKQCGPSGYTLPGPQLWINPLSLIGPFVWSYHCATMWTETQTSGISRSWSLSPLRKVWTRTSHLPLSPHRSNRL